MEEKERYQLERPNGTFSEIHDTKLDVWYSNRQPITELLNKQDKHIKELEAQEKFNFDYRDRCQLEEYQRWADKEITKLNNQNKQLKKQISKMEETLGRIMSGEYIPANIVDKSLKLSKQSQKQFAISELEKLKDFIDHNIEIENDMSALKLQEFYDNQIKKLKGEENE